MVRVRLDVDVRSPPSANAETAGPGVRGVRCGAGALGLGACQAVIRVGVLEKGLRGKLTRFAERQVAGAACAKAWKPEHSSLALPVWDGWGAACVAEISDEIACHFLYSVIAHDGVLSGCPLLNSSHSLGC